jgi:kumamolisin
MSDELQAVPGSAPVGAGPPVGYPSPAKEIEVKLSLPCKPLTPERTAALNDAILLSPHQRRYRTHAELTEALGASQRDLDALEDYFNQFNIRLKDSNMLLGAVTFAGTVSDFEQALHTQVAAFQVPTQTSFLSTTDAFKLPARLLGVVREAQPLHPPVRKESRLPTPPPAPPKNDQLLKAAPATGYPVVDLAKAYGFPEGLTGEGQVIGIVELGGKLNQADLRQFFQENDIKKPRIVEVGTPPPGNPKDAYVHNVEVTLDIQIAGALAPQAKLVVYYGTTLIEALQAIVGDEANKPTVVSISWAGSEYNYSPQEVEQMNTLLYQANLLGITIVAASADHGAYNNRPTPNVSLPSSSPLVLGCGGTTDDVEGQKLTSQVVWNEYSGSVASGGGYSSLYPLPTYQQQAVARYPYQKQAQRGVPDLAANASTIWGYRVIFGGQPMNVGGTSAATPFVAALLALCNEQLGYQVGFINPTLYQLAGSAAFRPITQGGNQVYAAAPYWNPCTGLGTPVGATLLALLRQLGGAPKPAALAEPTDPKAGEDQPAADEATPAPE